MVQCSVLRGAFELNFQNKLSIWPNQLCSALQFARVLSRTEDGSGDCCRWSDGEGGGSTDGEGVVREGNREREKFICRPMFNARTFCVFLGKGSKKITFLVVFYY